jgi:hypothetical protein
VTIGNQQYNLWRSKFGNQYSSSSAAGAAVPEPGASVYLFLISMAAIFCRFSAKRV